MSPHKSPQRKPRKPLLQARKEPAQARSKATCEAILHAAARILTRGGLSALNTNAVAHVAGVSVGSLYQYYPNKEALLNALSERHHTEIAARLATFARELTEKPKLPPLRKMISAVVDLALAHQFDHAQLAAALEYAERMLPESAALQELHQDILAAATELLRHYAREIRGDLATVAADILNIATALIDTAALKSVQAKPSRSGVAIKERRTPATQKTASTVLAEPSSEATNRVALKRRVERAILGYLCGAA
jgi:AcrR family transcriptional regulator